LIAGGNQTGKRIHNLTATNILVSVTSRYPVSYGYTN